MKEKIDEGDKKVFSTLSDESYNEKEYNNNLLAQYETVKRIKNKWKINLKGCITQKDNKYGLIRIYIISLEYGICFQQNSWRIGKGIVNFI